MERDMITARELAERLGVAENTVYRYKRKGMPYTSIGYKLLRFNFNEVVTWLDKQKKGQKVVLWHSTRASDNIHMQEMMKDYGNEGYAYYWTILEVLTNVHLHKLELHKLIRTIFKDYGKEQVRLVEFINDCVHKYKLLAYEGIYLYPVPYDDIFKWED